MKYNPWFKRTISHNFGEHIVIRMGCVGTPWLVVKNYRGTLKVRVFGFPKVDSPSFLASDRFDDAMEFVSVFENLQNNYTNLDEVVEALRQYKFSIENAYQLYTLKEKK